MCYNTSFSYVYICPLQLAEACRTGDVRAVQRLLSRGVGVNDTPDGVCTCVCWVWGGMYMYMCMLGMGRYVHVYVGYGEVCTCVC